MLPHHETPGSSSSTPSAGRPTPGPTSGDEAVRHRPDLQDRAAAALADAGGAEGEADGRAAPGAGPGKAPYPTAAQDARIADPAEMSAEEAIARIRKEGLTGRQLRMARRMANKHGLSPTSDIDAVRQLRLRGIDPFERANMLDLVVPDTGQEVGDRVQLPQTIPTETVPSTEVKRPAAMPRPPRHREIFEIQRDIARRRRRKLLLLAARLFVFVMLPTALAGYYYAVIATPMYSTKSEFVIQQADTAASAGGLGGLFSGTGLATSQDSITVQSYLTSRDAMLRLDQDVGFREVFSDPSIDPVQRLPEGASNEDAYDIYQDNVQIGYDPTEGIIKMEVIAPDPAVSADFSRHLIDYAEEQVDGLTERLRNDQMAGARESYEEAEERMSAAQARVLELQEQLGVLDPTSESAGVMSRVTAFETQLAEKRLQLQQLMDNRQPNQARVDGVRGDIDRLQTLIANLRSQLTTNDGEAASLAAITGQLRMAEVDLETRTLMMQQALQQLETARLEANRQVRYLSLGVNPVPPDEATYPRAFENTILAFLIFAGLYLMISLTASILREQVSS
ncbi:capsule biosynthesis protein [Mesobaculum littorinae]|uniref:Capsule biosynthesis protein n=2 Tax=Mesobaculum littorinae TaxID=2486419 RepID=A0A438ADR8_9RHOB|nr:capsule biosynthesis protein [Mesobaculum littorinae]